MMFTQKLTFLEKRPLTANFQNCFPKGFTTSQIHVLCANFVIYVTKKSARSPALASARIAPKICQGQLRTTYSECSKFHPNPLTSGGVIAGHVNIVETRHKVLPILGEATASSPSNKPAAQTEGLSLLVVTGWYLVMI